MRVQSSSWRAGPPSMRRRRAGAGGEDAVVDLRLAHLHGVHDGRPAGGGVGEGDAEGEGGLAHGGPARDHDHVAGQHLQDLVHVDLPVFATRAVLAGVEQHAVVAPALSARWRCGRPRPMSQPTGSLIGPCSRIWWARTCSAWARPVKPSTWVGSLRVAAPTRRRAAGRSSRVHTRSTGAKIVRRFPAVGAPSFLAACPDPRRARPAPWRRPGPQPRADTYRPNALPLSHQDRMRRSRLTRLPYACGLEVKAPRRVSVRIAGCRGARSSLRI